MKFVDYIVTFYGLYLVIQTLLMKWKCYIPDNFYFSGNKRVRKGADIKAYIDKVFWVTLLFGLMAIVCGGVGLYNDYVGGLEVLNAILCLGYFALILMYMLWMKKVQKEYLF